MKNNKTLRQILTGLIVGSLLGLVVLSILTIDIPAIVQSATDDKISGYIKMWSLWTLNENLFHFNGLMSQPAIYVNWNIGSAFLTLALVALICAGLKLAMCSVPALKETKSPVALILDCLLIIGIILAVIGLFAPMFKKVGDMKGEQDLTTLVVSALALISCGAPVAIGATAVNGAIALKAAK